MPAFGFGFGWGLSPHRRRQGTAGGVSLRALALSADTVPEGEGVNVGEIQNATDGSTLSLIDDAGGLFLLADGVIATFGLDYETATSHSITVRETLDGAINSPRDTVLTVHVTDVSVTLGALTVSPQSISHSASVGANVGTVGGFSGADGFSIAMTGNAGGRFVLAGFSVNVASALTAGSYNIELTETAPEATNSPRASIVTITVS
jgi:hypothetical protein